VSNLYTLSDYYNRVMVLDESNNYVTKWGSNGVGDSQFDYAYGICLDSLGNVYVADTVNHRIQKFTSTGTFVWKKGANGGDGSSGEGDGEFDCPWGLVVFDNKLYVCEYGNSRIQILDLDGNYLTKWSTDDYVEDVLYSPSYIYPDSLGNLYVTDQDDCNVQVFDSSGAFLRFIGAPGSGDGELDCPYGIVLDSSNNIYVADYDNIRVQKLANDGTYLMTLAGKIGTGNGTGEIMEPWGLRIDSLDNIYIADESWDSDRIQKFDSSGNYIKTFVTYNYGYVYDNMTNFYIDSSGTRYCIIEDNMLKLNADGSIALVIYGHSWTGGTDCLGVVVNSSTGNIYLACEDDNIYIYDSEGIYINQFGGTGSGDGQFDVISNLNIDSSGNIYVVDAGNYRVQKFDSSGSFLIKFGSVGTGNGEFTNLGDIAVDSTGNIYVSDSCHDTYSRVQKFSSSGAYQLQFNLIDFGASDNPASIGVDSSGNIYAGQNSSYIHSGITYGSSNVQKFNSSGAWQLSWEIISDDPGAIAVDVDDKVHVACYNINNVQVFDTSGNFIESYCAKSDNNVIVSYNVYSFAVDSNYVYIPDYWNNCVKVYSKTGAYIASFGDGYLYGTLALAIDYILERIYVTDEYGGKVKYFDLTTFAYEGEFGSYGKLAGQVWYPVAIAVDSNSNIYTVDDSGSIGGVPTGPNRIQKWNPAGVFQTAWNLVFDEPARQQGLVIDSDDNLYLSTHYHGLLGDGIITKYDVIGNILLSWIIDAVVAGIAIDTTDKIYVPTFYDGLLTFDTDGTPVDVIAGDFESYGIAVDPSKNIYIFGLQIKDNYDYLITKYNSSFAFERYWGDDGVLYQSYSLGIDYREGIVTTQQVSLLLTQHRIAREKQQIKDYSFDCLTASDGTIDFDTPIINKVNRVVIKPDTGATQPDNLFDVVINDIDGNDILGGWGQDCSNSVNTDLLPDKISDPKVNGQLNILVSNAGNAKGLNIRIYYTW
jgi:tripartite motif-containing protein 71